MKNYVFIYYGGSGSTDPKDMEAMKKGYMEWFSGLGDKLVDAGNPFNTGGQAVEKSGVSTIENFPASGYSIVKADSMDAAVAIAKSCPLTQFDNAAVRVYETLPM